MRPLLSTSIFVTILYLFTCCSNDFLNENLSSNSYTLAQSTIYISPDWQRSNYVFILPSVEDVDYSIVSKPSWLTMEAENGHLSDSIAIVACTASKNPDFEETGIYMDFITVRAAGKTFKVPIAYITEGDPEVVVDNDLSLEDNYLNNYLKRPALSIHNDGDGVLIWKITSLPNWLEIDLEQLENYGTIILPFTSSYIPLRFNMNNIHSSELTGEVVISTNDKNHPTSTIQVAANLGTPQLQPKSHCIRK